MPDYVWVDQVVAALPDLAHPEVAAPMAWPVHHAGRGPDDALAPGGRRLLPGPGSGWRDQVGGLAAIIRTIEERTTAREWFVTRCGSRSTWTGSTGCDRWTTRAVSSPPDQAWLTANRATSGRTQAVLRRIRFTLDDATAMNYAVNVEG